jgi:cellulose synthase/poly-beta-1,6-N-acetylglucosamine synthase-like glycosyltransferase
MIQQATLLFFCLFLLIFGMMYFMGMWLRVFHPDKVTVPRDYSLKPRVSILLPCFNDAFHVKLTIESILSSNYPRDNIEIIIVDDCSTDDSWNVIQQTVTDIPNVKLLRHEVNQGKFMALAHAGDIASGDFVVCIDSDCIFHKDALSELMACFSDPKMGGVGGIIGVNNPNENILTQMQTFWYYYAFQALKMIENSQRSVFCLSGCLAAIRKTAFDKIKQGVMDHNFLGKTFTAGEDRYMTHLLLLAGYDTFVNIDARCWTEVPAKWTKFYMQQVRWIRGGMEQIYVTLSRLSQYVTRFNSVSLAALYLPSIAVFVLPLFLILKIVSSQSLFLSIISGAFIVFPLLVTLAILSHFHILARSPEQRLNSPILAACALGIWCMIGGLFVVITSICTLDSSSWGTRGKS